MISFSLFLPKDVFWKRKQKGGGIFSPSFPFSSNSNLSQTGETEGGGG